MAMFKLPLSGDVAQTINPWTAIFNPVGGQWGLVNITLGKSSDPKVEAEVIAEVAGYGQQLGRIGDAVDVLARRLLHSHSELSSEDRAALTEFTDMLAEIRKVKARHDRKHVKL